MLARIGKIAHVNGTICKLHQDMCQPVRKELSGEDAYFKCGIELLEIDGIELATRVPGVSGGCEHELALQMNVRQSST